MGRQRRRKRVVATLPLTPAPFNRHRSAGHNRDRHSYFTI